MIVEFKCSLDIVVDILDHAIVKHIEETGKYMSLKRVIKKTINGTIVKKGGEEEMKQVQALVVEPPVIGPPREPQDSLSAIERADKVQEELKREKEARKQGKLKREERNLNCSQLAYYWTRSSIKDQTWFLNYIQKHNKLGEIQCLIESYSKKRSRKLKS